VLVNIHSPASRSDILHAGSTPEIEDMRDHIYPLRRCWTDGWGSGVDGEQLSMIIVTIF